MTLNQANERLAMLAAKINKVWSRPGSYEQRVSEARSYWDAGFPYRQFIHSVECISGEQSEQKECGK